MSTTLQGQRILVTQSDEFMGPAICEARAEHGAEVVASRGSLVSPGAAESLIAATGPIDILIAYLCGQAANCFVGQVFPVCGGWAIR